MAKAAMAALLAAALTMAAPWGRAQESTRSEHTSGEGQPLATPQVRVTVTFTEFEGEKKVKSLPYTLITGANGAATKAVLKMGSRVPIYAGGKDYEMQYLDVGSNIDCTASRARDNRFELKLSLDRSWLEGDVSVPIHREVSSPSSSGQFPEPIVRQFKSELSLTLGDGQAAESTLATDPLSGKVFKVEVSLSVLK
ncbi:MAG: hypothetical protein J2P13_08140 [Acidobacteria bacterium]|nr:hypothetical protein [Acidobacteriota bacterium]